MFICRFVIYCRLDKAIPAKLQLVAGIPGKPGLPRLEATLVRLGHHLGLQDIVLQGPDIPVLNHKLILTLLAGSMLLTKIDQAKYPQVNCRKP